MRDVVAACKHIDRASVYRTVALFEQLGIVQRLQMGWKYRLELSDDFHEHHHHLHCVSCGQTTALPEDNELEKSLHAMAQAHNFQLQSHQLELGDVAPIFGTAHQAREVLDGKRPISKTQAKELGKYFSVPAKLFQE